MQTIYESRQAAILNTGNKYFGKICSRCSTSVRYLNGGCILCAKTKAKLRDKQFPDEHRQRTADWRDKHREHHNEIARLWRNKNAQKCRDKTAKWRTAHSTQYQISRQISRAKRRTREYEAEGTYKSTEWKFLKQKYQNRCLRCDKKETDLLIETGLGLTPDHVIPLKRGGSNYITNIQPLCINCNRANYIYSLRYGSQKDYR